MKGVIYGTYWDNGKENGNCYLGFRAFTPSTNNYVHSHEAMMQLARGWLHDAAAMRAPTARAAAPGCEARHPGNLEFQSLGLRV